ncbi:PH domain-containing protein [Streptomyces sp. NBC_00572]|uniref:PH domain-containing protein n=1 Tax=Streptomyces sp. NBC_00572 TaxID=2903664 RepID=UPI002257FABA|nr:PH domain-containing protein [Streptomyces sp. NBC_00572]MCX4985112.1 PH domain-containing protein [Streptomyces sp. NBC_00572]
MQPTSDLPIPTHHLGSTAQQVVLTTVGGVFALVGVLAFFKADGPFGIVLLLVIGVAGAWIAVRGAVVGVRVDAAGITERGLGRSRTVSWCSLREVTTSLRGTGPAGTGAPSLVLRDGTEVPLPAISSYSPRATQTYLDVISGAHAVHRAACRGCDPA